jgi:hypothetical protein
MRHVLVFAGGMSETARRSLEDRLTAELEAKGVAARQSYKLFPEQTDKNGARDAARATGFDGALVATLRGIRDRPVYVPGGWGGFWSGYYGGGWGYSPGYVINDEIVSVETSLWDLHDDGKLVWSITTRTDNPSSGDDAAKSLTKELVPKLLATGLLVRAI